MAIAVTATLGDSIVGVKHCFDPRAGRMTRTTKLLIALTVVCLDASLVAFAAGVHNAADNEHRYRIETEVRHRPSYAVRLHRLPASCDWIAFGGFAAAIALGAAALLRRHREHASSSVRIGSAPGVDFATDQVRELALVAPAGDGFALHLERGMVGEIVDDGECTRFANLPCTTLSPIPPDASIRVVIGPLALHIIASAESAPRAIPPARASDRNLVPYLVTSLAIHLGTWRLLGEVPVDNDDDELVSDSFEIVERDGVWFGARLDDAGDPGETLPEAPTGAYLDDAGEPDKPLPEAPTCLRLDVRPDQAEIAALNVQARARAIEAARHAGILGATYSDPFAPLSTGPDFASAFEGPVPTNLFGPSKQERRFVTFDLTTPHCCADRRHGEGLVVQLGQPNVQGNLDKATVRRYIKRNLDRIAFCYERALLAQPDLQGTVLTEFLIGPDGRVLHSEASAYGNLGGVPDCIANAVEAIQFPSPTGGGAVQVTFPFTLRPSRD